MADTEKRKIVRRSAEERVAEIDAKIATCKATIAKQEEKIAAKAKASGMTNEEIAEKLGITIE